MLIIEIKKQSKDVPVLLRQQFLDGLSRMLNTNTKDVRNFIGSP